VDLLQDPKIARFSNTRFSGWSTSFPSSERSLCEEGHRIKEWYSGADPIQSSPPPPEGQHSPAVKQPFFFLCLITAWPCPAIRPISSLSYSTIFYTHKLVIWFQIQLIVIKSFSYKSLVHL
jgi:hypothetical protein